MTKTTSRSKTQRKLAKLARDPRLFFADFARNQARRFKRRPRSPIFCFWEPRSAMPAYLQMCMETWQRHLNDAEIVLMDRSNVHEYYDVSLYNQSNLETLSLPKQADAIRAAVLEQNGGLWLDCDTIVLRDLAPLVEVGKTHDVITFGKAGSNTAIGIIYAPRPGARMLREWRQAIQAKLNQPEFPADTPWDFVGNSIINPWISGNTFPEKEWKILEWRDFGIFPEAATVNAWGMSNYREFWFDRNRKIDAALVGPNQMMIALHNSWAPDSYRKLNRAAIAGDSNELLSRVIRYALLK